MKFQRSNPTIVVLGAAGFIGFHIARQLSRVPGTRLRLVDNFVRGERDEYFLELIDRDNVEFLERDLTKSSSFDGLFEELDEVYNCVALNGTQNFYEKPLDVIMNSAIPSIFAANYAGKASVKRYFYLGSSESYAGALSLGLVDIPTSEKIPHVFPNLSERRWSYGISKSIGEFATEASRVQWSLNSCILRVHNVYGPRMGDKHVIPDLVRKFRNGLGIVHGLDETRSFMYVDDFVDAVMQLRQIEDLPSVINVGATTETTIHDLAIEIMKLLEINLELLEGGSFSGSVKRRLPDTTLLRSLVQLRLTPLREGLESYLKSEGLL